jgi:hypothetical protein
LGESPEGGALTPEQQEELARHFALKPTLVSALSKHLGDALDLNISHAYFEISRQVAEKKGNEVVRRVLQGLGKLKEQAANSLHELEPLQVHPDAPDAAHEILSQARVGFNEALAHLQQIHNGLEEASKSYCTAFMSMSLDRRRVVDLRRRRVLPIIFIAWQSANRSLTYTTDSLSSKRGGPLTKFVNTVVSCVIETPAEMSGQVIIRELRRFLKNRGPKLIFSIEEMPSVSRFVFTKRI